MRWGAITRRRCGTPAWQPSIRSSGWSTDHDIACDFDRVPGFRHVALGADDGTAETRLDILRAEAALARDMGFDVEMVAAAPLGSAAGLADRRPGAVSPAQLPARAAVATHRRRRASCAATAMCRFPDDADTLTAGGFTIRAPHVVLATHMPIAGRQSAAAAGVLQSTLAAYTSYAIAAHVGQPVENVPALAWDTAQPYHYLRTRASERRRSHHRRRRGPQDRAGDRDASAVHAARSMVPARGADCQDHPPLVGPGHRDARRSAADRRDRRAAIRRDRIRRQRDDLRHARGDDDSRRDRRA